jgi:hypothetical protein
MGSRDAAVLIGTSKDEQIEFYRLGKDVYRVGRGWVPDVVGVPMGMRWECTVGHWNRYRQSVYLWVIDAE